MNISTNTAVLQLAFCCAIAGCSMLADFALDQATGGSGKGGINTELVVGDKEQVLGTNLEVKAKNVGKINGTSDTSVQASNANKVEVTNNTFPYWVIGLLIILSGLVGYLSPRPQAWKRLIKGNSNDNPK